MGRLQVPDHQGRQERAPVLAQRRRLDPSPTVARCILRQSTGEGGTDRRGAVPVRRPWPARLSRADASSGAEASRRDGAVVPRLRPAAAQHSRPEAEAAQRTAQAPGRLSAWAGRGDIRTLPVRPIRHRQRAAGDVRKKHLDGIVSKRLDRPYASGPTKDWVKVKCGAWKESNRRRHEVFAKR